MSRITLKTLKIFFIPILLLFTQSACVSAYIESVGGKSTRLFERIYYTDFDTAWQSVLDALKASILDVTNKEGGYLQTKWTDNTTDKNFIDSYGSSNAYLKAQFRLKISLSRGFFNGKPTIKVSIQREQLVQRDVLEGWVPLETDDFEENTLLYRIGRLIYIKTKISKLEEEKAKRVFENFEASGL